MIVVADTSPLNYLVQLELSDLLATLYREVLIPTTVWKELLAPRSRVVVREWATSPPSWLRIEDSEPIISPHLDRLDAGERTAIELAIAHKANVMLIDEHDARAVASAVFGFKVTGTLGVFSAAHGAGLINGLEAYQRLISTTNFYQNSALHDLYLQSLKPR